MQSIEELIKYLGLIPHPEGGYYKEMHHSTNKIEIEKDKYRYQYTSIYFLLTKENPSRFHRLTSDELWYFHSGSPLTVHMINKAGQYLSIELGHQIDKGQVLQAVVPAGVIFGSSVNEGYSLVSCAVAPGFDFEDFELMDQQELLALFPKYKNIIEKLT